MTRQIVLDTETTGLDPAAGHRIIEIGCVEMRERRLTGHNWHHYLQPDRDIDAGAEQVHGISSAFLADKPRFEELADDLCAYLEGAELLIHNAEFDVGFLEHEFARCGRRLTLGSICTVTDTLAMARRQFPGQRNSLDALCKRLSISNAHRTLHGALLDSEILADVYLAMTGGQTTLSLDAEASGSASRQALAADVDLSRLVVIEPSVEERRAHEMLLDVLESSAESGCVWRRLSECAPSVPCPEPSHDP